MQSPRQEPSPADGLFSRKIELPWLILAALLLSTIFAAYQSSKQHDADADARFREIATAESQALLRSLSDIQGLTLSIAALAAAQPNLDNKSWNAFFDARMPVADYAGLVAVQLALTTAGGKDSTLLTRDLGKRGAVAGADWSAQPPLAAALALAAARNRITLSAPLPATGDGLPRTGAGMAMVQPIAARPGARPGHVIAIVDLRPLMNRLVADNRNLDVALRDGATPLFAGAGGADRAVASRSLTLALPFGGRDLQLTVRSTPELEARLHSNTPRTVLLIGLLSAALLGGLIWLLTRLREQAQGLAEAMTRKLQDQTKFTEDLIEFNPNPIFRQDADGRFVAVNRAWERLSGRRREDVLGRRYDQFQEAALAAANQRLDAELFASSGGRDSVDAIVTDADGRQFETIIAKQVLKGSDGGISGLIGNITDVTPIKQLEREVARQREQLNLVIRSSQQGIWDLELKDGGSAYFSERFREILGYADGGFPARFEWRDTIHPDDLASFRADMLRHFKRETPLFDAESRALNKQGETIWLRTRAIAQHDDGGRAVRFVGSIADVTDRRQAQQELLDANVRVTEAARAKEAFLATMSHEIRTPLNGVLGMATLLAETELNDEQHDYIRLIRTSGDTLLRLIDDVLDFSKIESGRMTLESAPLEIVQVIEEAVDLVAEKARSKQLALLFDTDDSTPHYILGDSTRLRQILLNLLSNAIKFTERGEITIFARTERTVDGQLRLECRVSDTGIGIPAQRVGQLFQPFTQVDASTTRKYGGTGLGLAICRRLTQLMGGDIRVESSEGRGSVFIFTIITRAARGPIKPHMQPNAAELAGKRLLVVDRSASRREILAHRYRRWGIEPHCVAPEEAAAALAAGTFDILLTDMVLPEPAATALGEALAADDRMRQAKGQPLIASILASGIARTELAQREILPPIRHEMFVMRPASRARMFELLIRAAQQLPSQDIATRPFTEVPTRPPADYAPGGARVRPRVAGTPDALPKAGSLNILVAEDNEVNQRVIVGMLKNLGHRCQLVGDGVSAVEAALAGSFDAVLMDIHMPELDGVAATERIRERLAGPNCPPIIAMTAHALPGDRERYIGAGLDDYLPKPIRSAALASVLNRVVRRAEADSTGEDHHTAAAIVDPRLQDLPLLDLEQLEDLRGLPAAPGELVGDPGDSPDGGDTIGGLIRLFQTQARARLAAIDQRRAAGQWRDLSETAHSLRGAAASMGFPRVALLCKDLENAASAFADGRGNDAAALDHHIADIKRHFGEAESALARWKLTAPGAG